MSGFGFENRTASGAAADAARKLAGSDATALWRLPGDGAIELVHESGSRVQFWRVYGDGVSELVDSAPTPFRRRLFGWTMRFGFAVLAISFLAAAFGSEASPVVEAIAWSVFGLAFAAMFATGFIAPSGKKVVRQWVLDRFGTDETWTTVPRASELGTEATGNQAIAIAALADGHGGRAYARTLEDGTIEVATSVTDGVEIHHVDEAGRATLTETVREKSSVPTIAGLVLAALLFGFAYFAAGWPAKTAFAVGVVLVIVAFAIAPSLGDIRRTRGESDEWREVRTDEPPSD